MKINYDEIDEDMRDIVRNFNKAGYVTTQSCQGHLYNEDGATSISVPYLRFKVPEDSTMLSFVINNLTILMHVNMIVPVHIDECYKMEDASGETIFITDVDKFINKNDYSNFEVGIYLNSYILDDNDRFLELRKLFLKDLLELSEYLITCNEVYRECY